jgi:hypothetical protein
MESGMIEEAKVIHEEAQERAEWEKPVLTCLQTKEAEGAANAGADGGVFS